MIKIKVKTRLVAKCISPQFRGISAFVAWWEAEDGHQQGRESESRQRDDEAYGAHHCTGNEMMSVRSSMSTSS